MSGDTDNKIITLGHVNTLNYNWREELPEEDSTKTKKKTLRMFHDKYLNSRNWN